MVLILIPLIILCFWGSASSKRKYNKNHKLTSGILSVILLILALICGVFLFRLLFFFRIEG